MGAEICRFSISRHTESEGSIVFICERDFVSKMFDNAKNREISDQRQVKIDKGTLSRPNFSESICSRASRKDWSFWNHSAASLLFSRAHAQSKLSVQPVFPCKGGVLASWD
ncbi:hypothetical protein CSB45_10140 [candidate division KSB3 bacterium]|uniref:Uncharacterized protein n=1 Tax=candidate division KSB3 bacterium TaxID=2044937 RepID=A0A2G6E410_9BACT|nr:MAG: hypothetical protein CSB45_10140 [candidate division KSB3 bacterium]PIE29326.1 MAG: hypothetical protein CSA57_08955 [candidate division KSB3 bacterium]